MHLKHISISISEIATKAASMGIGKAVSLEMTKAVEKGAFLLACLLMLGGASANAQNQKKMATVEKDTIPFFRGMAVGVDVIGPVQLMVSDYGQYEASLRINLKDKYYPVFELGYGKADASDESTKINYKTSAPYARIGIDWNLLKNKHDDYRLFGGFRYGFTFFKYDVTSPPIQDNMGWRCSLWSRRREEQLSLAGRSLRSRCQDMGSRPHGMELPIQTPVG